jgi:hypothetical protein
MKKKEEISKALQLVSYGQAQQLKELGFNWECDHLYRNGLCIRADNLTVPGSLSKERYYDWNSLEPDYGILSAPSVALALKWMDVVMHVTWYIRMENGVYYGNVQHHFYNEQTAGKGYNRDVVEKVVLSTAINEADWMIAFEREMNTPRDESDKITKKKFKWAEEMSDAEIYAEISEKQAKELAKMDRDAAMRKQSERREKELMAVLAEEAVEVASKTLADPPVQPFPVL